MSFIKDFGELGKGDAAIAGGKGASLGEMTQAGIPVPPGFVVLSEAFEDFLKETDLDVEIDSILHGVDTQKMHTVEHTSETIQKLILEAKMPEGIEKEIRNAYTNLFAQPARNASPARNAVSAAGWHSDAGGFVAVRSSATAEDSASAAWAGQLDSFLNTTEESLLKNVQRCWASLFTPRAIFYRFEQGLHSSKISVAVVVQKMVESEVSGIVFSVHPVTEDYNQLIIEAGFGLGEAIVSGQITPDSYVVEKDPRRIIDKNIAEQERGIFRKSIGEEEPNEWREIAFEKRNEQKLSDEQILELSEIIIGIENHYGFPCDIEWAYEGACPPHSAEQCGRGKFYIVQSRPITTLTNQKPSADSISGTKKEKDTELWTKDFSMDDGTYQVLFPFFQLGIELSQQALFGKETPYFLTKVFFHYRGRSTEGGYYLDQQMKNLSEAINALIYSDPDVIFKNHKEAYEINDQYTAFSWHCLKTNLEELTNEQLATLHRDLTMLQERAHVWAVCTTWFVDSYGATFSTGLLQKTKEIVNLAGSKRNFAEVFSLFTTPPKNSLGIEEEIESLEIVTRIFEDKQAYEIFRELREYTKIPDGISAELKQLMTAHCEKWCWTPFGYTGPAYGIDYYLSVWAGLIREKAPVEEMIKEKKDRPRKIEQERVALFEELNVSDAMRKVYDIGADITALKGYRKDCSYLGCYAADYILKEVSKRTSIPLDDFRFLTYIEVGDILNGALQYDVTERNRREQCAIHYYDEGKFTMLSGKEAEDFYEAKAQKIKREVVEMDADSFTGNCACSGHAEGRVKIVNRPEEMGKMEQGDIMVSHTTFPSLVPAMNKAAALVTEDGGITCHAAIVARELHLPCVTGIKVATKVLHDGDLVEVDADNGVVKILERVRENEKTSRIAHYLSEPMTKMGQWSLLPADMENWFSGDSPRYFEELFGFPKAQPNIYIPSENRIQNYLNESFFTKLYAYIRDLTAKDYKGLEKKLSNFSQDKEQAKQELTRATSDNFSSLTTEELVDLYQRNRDIVHRITTYDHFGMEGEDYWPPLMRKILTEKFGLKEDTPEYHTVLFALTKPKEISTSLEEERAVLKHTIAVKEKKEAKQSAAQMLAQEFGWLPVFAYGTPWGSDYYLDELAEHDKKTLDELKKEYDKLNRYTVIREKEIEKLVKKYDISLQDLQIFVDFGLATDVRNEAEFVVSYGGYCLLPIYEEIAKRLSLDYHQLRTLFEDEIIACLQGKSDPLQLLEQKKNIVAWGFDSSMRKRINYTEEEARELFRHLEATSKVAGQKDGDSDKGVCASPGKASGAVRILRSPKENHRVEAGDILISYGTTVDYLPAMKKAAAIVTESGGLTCHAAVVSREFGIPCVVGFKDAMTIFRDGDLVEVDADNGAVKILERAKEKKKTCFEKTIERDSTFFMQGIFAQVMAGENYLSFGKDNPYHPVIVHVATGDNIQIWENSKAIEWFFDKLLEKNRNGTEFLQRVVDDYRDVLKSIKPYWEMRDFSDTKKLSEYVELVKRGNADVSLIYYSGNDERTPEKVKQLAIEARKEDEFFARNDEFVRQRVAAAGYDPRAAAVVLPDEFVALPSEEELLSRSSGSVLVEGNDVEVTSFSSFIERHPEYEFENFIAGTWDGTEIVGQIACPGNVRGRVRIVKNQSQAQLVQKDEIIVAPMTTPDFAPAMQRAAAFVTDEGGIVCHAAIVAREMKKPCIIGTKIATQVLHDGDLVEVDADNGVVRIIEKKKNILPVYKRQFSRERSLSFIECWSRGESTDPRQYVDESQPFMPYIVLESKGGLVSCYMDERGIDHIVTVLRGLVDKDKEYPKKAADIFRKKLIRAHELWNKAESLSHEELKILLTDIRDAWPWFEVIWWLAERVVDEEDRKLLLEARIWGEGIGVQSDSIVVRSLKNIFPELGDLVSYLSYEEVMSGTVPAMDILRLRKEHYIFTDATLFTDVTLQELGEKYRICFEEENISSERVDVLSGETAYKGKVTGRVKKVFVYSDSEKVEKGDILVAPLTEPTYLPAIKKAAALVTDEGGVMCHTAISAREFKKPCIIGTKIATQVLHDGDMVEVDADNGVVRIVKL